MIWVDSDLRIVDITRDVPPPEPETPVRELLRYSPSGPAQYVLEINGGLAAVHGIEVGDVAELVPEG